MSGVYVIEGKPTSEIVANDCSQNYHKCCINLLIRVLTLNSRHLPVHTLPQPKTSLADIVSINSHTHPYKVSWCYVCLDIIANNFNI